MKGGITVSASNVSGRFTSVAWVEAPQLRFVAGQILRASVDRNGQGAPQRVHSRAHPAVLMSGHR